MNKTYTLKGLDCANCAAKIENAVKSLDGVTSASVNLMTATLKIEVNESENIKGNIDGIVHMYEP
ncbi:MAG: heavy-metal-associated domain-containing protein, partial [Clostridiales bacterium]|nr:heavy-metal-associated domain-containing protein [Clostridiales bacterium]